MLTVDTAAPDAAAQCFGSALPLAVRYRDWLATAGVDRGLLGPREVDRLWERHLLNSAALRDWLPQQGVVLDLGSGAGLPGVVVALLRPDLEVVLLEPLLRRASFLTEVVADLALPSTTVVRARAEDHARTHPESVDTVVARAVAPLERLVGWAAPLIRPGGFLLALKGETVSDELAQAADVATAWGMAAGEVLPVAVGDSVTRVVRLQREQSVVPGGAAPDGAAPHRAGRRSR